MRYLGPDVSPAANASAGCRRKGKASQFDFDQIDRRKVRLPVFFGMSRFIGFP
jgi:hypothetical protein